MDRYTDIDARREYHKKFRQSGWYALNQILAELISLEANVLIGLLVSQESYLIDNRGQMLNNQKEFILLDNDYIKDRIGVSAYLVQKSAKIIQFSDLIETKHDARFKKMYKLIGQDIMNSKTSGMKIGKMMRFGVNM